jgi:hypothetical protein
MANFGLPTQKQKIWNDVSMAGQASIDVNWYKYFNDVRNWIIENSQSGTTAQRPTTNLYVGRLYCDTTLGYYIHVHSTNPTVWHNEAGAVV